VSKGQTKSLNGKGITIMIEYSITVKDETNTLTVKDICYDSILISKENPFLKERVKSAVDKFCIEPQAESPEIILKFKTIWQN
jgi:hypothetical protein